MQVAGKQVVTSCSDKDSDPAEVVEEKWSQLRKT
jgi:hypothetical protein